MLLILCAIYKFSLLKGNVSFYLLVCISECRHLVVLYMIPFLVLPVLTLFCFIVHFIFYFSCYCSRISVFSYCSFVYIFVVRRYHFNNELKRVIFCCGVWFQSFAIVKLVLVGFRYTEYFSCCLFLLIINR